MITEAHSHSVLSNDTWVEVIIYYKNYVVFFLHDINVLVYQQLN